ncbi:hypothetical protein Taro_036859 [Colocasia esculenta]|uniref:Importin N-terminal domain-containing protein n=1 Tax=Colocasia esculenta TaxID=4460 RepID=A0A843W469_COLES|nr:hypothetical protein [Colocasia esculenta]
MAAEKLRDLSQPIDVPLLDATVAAFYGTGSKEERSTADQILRELQNNPDTWLQVVHILQNSQNLNTKFFALQVSYYFSSSTIYLRNTFKEKETICVQNN